MKAWYFSKTDKKLRYGDDREIAIGVTHEIEGTPILCNRGLHGSRLLLDALYAAPGSVIWRVELSGEMDVGFDKIAAQKRTYLSGGIDISDVLRKFARLCALDVAHLWDVPDVVIQFLKTGDESLRSAAQTAAQAAAQDAAWTAYWYPWDASLDASRDSRGAAWAAAKDASLDASWGASRGAIVARDAARLKQNRRLTAMVSRAIKEES